MLLGTKNHTMGDSRRWEIDYSEFLRQGVVLSDATVTSSSTTATIDTVSLTDDQKRVIFYTHGGALNEVFTASVQATDSQSEVINDTVQFIVVAP